MPDEPFKGFRITSDPDATSIEQPGQDPAREVHPLPLRLLLVSDLAPHASVEDWAGPSRVHRVDKNSLRALMEALAPRLNLDVPNTISDAPRLLEVDLAFPTLDAFRPEQVAQQVPALASLTQVRALVARVRRGEIDLDAFRVQLAATGVDAMWAERLYQTLSAPEAPTPTTQDPSPSASAPSGEGGALDRVLGMVDLGDEASETPAPPKGGGGFMGTLIDAFTGETGAASKVEKTAADRLLDDLDDVLSNQLNAIFRHAAFRRLEAAWRGLKFLVDRIDFRKGVQLEVLAAGKDDLSEVLYHQVLVPEHSDEHEKPPLSCVIVDIAFDNSNADLALLDDLADTGASLQAPLIVSAAPAFFGVDDYRGLAGLPPLWQHVERPEYIAWNKLREKRASQYLALALPAFLLRLPYGAENPAAPFVFNEEGGLWGNAVLAVAAAIAGSFTRTGWPTHFVGSSEGLEHLPLWPHAEGQSPLAVLLPASKLPEFSKGGFVVLSGKVNHDALHVARAATVCLPEAYEDLMAATEARIHVTLACTLFVAQAAHHVLAVQQTIVPGTPVAQVKQEAEARLRAFFHTQGHAVPPDAVEIQQVDDSGMEGHDLLAIRLRTPRYVLDRPVSLVMGLPVPKG